MSLLKTSRFSALLNITLAAYLSASVAGFLTLAGAQTGDEKSLRSLAETLYGLYDKEDTGGIISLWSGNSPYVAESRLSFQKQFADNSSIKTVVLSFRVSEAETDRATISVIIDVSAENAKMGRPSGISGRYDRSIDVVKEANGWKLWRYRVTADDVAAALTAVTTEEERAEVYSKQNPEVLAELPFALIARGVRFNLTGKGEEALKTLGLARQIAQQSNNKKALAKALLSVGTCYLTSGDQDASLINFEKSLAVAEEAGDESVAAAAMFYLGFVHARRNNYDVSLEYLNKSLDRSVAIGHDVIQTQALNVLGKIYAVRNRYDDALACYTRALNIAEKLEENGMYGTVLTNIGEIHRAQGRYDEALTALEKGLKIATEAKYKLVMALASEQLGSVYQAYGRYKEAFDHYQQGLKLAEEVDEKGTIGIYPAVLQDLGDFYFLQNNTELALDYYRKGLELAKSTNNKALVIAITASIGNGYSARGDYKEAVAQYESSLEIARSAGEKRGVSSIYNNLGYVYQRLKKYENALANYDLSLKSAEEIGDRAQIATTSKNQGAVYLSMGWYDKSIETLNNALTLAKELNAPEIAWEAYTTAGRTYRALNQPEKSQQSFEAAISTVEQLRSNVLGGVNDRQKYFEEKVAPYYEMVDLLINRNGKDAFSALTYAERAKGRALLDILQSGATGVTKAMTSAEREQERKIQQEIFSLNTQIASQNLQQTNKERFPELHERLHQARLKREAFESTLFAAHPKLRALRGEIQPLTQDKIDDLIPDQQTALAEYVVLENKTYLFMITRSDPTKQSWPSASMHIYPINVSKTELMDLTDGFYRRVATGDLEISALSRRLYDILIKPAEAHLKDKTRLGIVPDGILWNVPFAALRSSSDDRYLIEKTALFYAPSLSVLSTMRARNTTYRSFSKSDKTLLAVSSPTVVDGEQQVNTWAERQVQELQKLYGADASRVLVGGEARKRLFEQLAGDYRVLHLVTHGVLDNLNPMYSYLSLADERLEARDLMGLNLRAEMVVASACDTARGRIGAGEGVIGMTWALFVAGSPTSVASQWKVEYDSTSKLMVEFHHQLLGGKQPVSKAEALQKAALTLLRGEENKKYRHPFYWASFIVMGDGLSAFGGTARAPGTYTAKEPGDLR